MKSDFDSETFHKKCAKIDSNEANFDSNAIIEHEIINVLADKEVDNFKYTVLRLNFAENAENGEDLKTKANKETLRNLIQDRQSVCRYVYVHLQLLLIYMKEQKS